MGFTLGQKLIKSHLVSGDMTPGSEVGIRIDQTLTQDATGTMAYLEFEAMGVERVRTELSVAYIDHNTLQKSTVFIFHVPETAFAIRYIWSASASPVKRSSALTATPPRAAVSACSPSARAA